MLASSRANIQSSEAEFRIHNFEVTLMATATEYKFSRQFREIVSGPILLAHGMRFAVVVSWSATKESYEKSKALGLNVRKLDPEPSQWTWRPMFEVINTKPKASVCYGKKGPFLMGKGQCMDVGWSGDDGIGITLQALLDPSKGWLQNGTLRIKAKVEVLTLEQTISPACPQTGGQQEVCDSFKAFLFSQDFADVTILVGDVQLPAHSQILAARSPVFRVMLSNPMAETLTRQVTIEDLEVDAVKSLLHYMYTGSIEETVLEDNCLAGGLLKAAHRFEMQGLVLHCVEAITARLTIDNAVGMLELADLMSCDDFKEKCLEFIHMNLAAVQSANGFEEITERRPRLLREIMAMVVPPASKKPRQS